MVDLLTKVQPEHLLILNALLLFMISLLLGLIGYLLKRHFDGVDGRITETNSENKETERSLKEVSSHLHSFEKNTSKTLTKLCGAMESTTVAVNRQKANIGKILAKVQRLDSHFAVEKTQREFNTKRIEKLESSRR